MPEQAIQLVHLNVSELTLKMHGLFSLALRKVRQVEMVHQRTASWINGELFETARPGTFGREKRQQEEQENAETRGQQEQQEAARGRHRGEQPRGTWMLQRKTVSGSPDGGRSRIAKNRTWSNDGGNRVQEDGETQNRRRYGRQ